jgi:two-component system cell cycle sensor histidine kinase PleC
LPAATQQVQADPRGDDLFSALDSLRIAVTIFDPQGRLIHANRHLNFIFPTLPPVTRLVGEPYEELVRRELASGAIAKSARPHGDEAFIAARLAQLQPGAYAPFDVALSDGRILEIKARRDVVGRAVLLWSDVTQSRHHLGRLEEAVALSADAVAFYDKADRFLMGNDLYARIAGMTLEELQGRSFTDVITQVARSGRVRFNIPVEEWLVRRLAGHRAEASAQTVKLGDGTVYLVRTRATADGGRVLIFTDITDKTRAEAALKLAEQALEEQRANSEIYLADLSERLDRASAEAEGAKTTLLRAMSHELKTPLNAILGFSDLMKTMADDLSPAQVREYAGLVHQGGASLLRLVNQIMDLTKLAAGRYDLRLVRLEMGNALKRTMQDFADAAQARSITLDLHDCAPGLWIEADDHIFGSMLGHLLDNALTFVHPGGAVRVSAQRSGGMVAVTVADNGPGVLPRDLERIQRPFEQAGDVTEHAKGSGLGLTLVKAFAELHGGALALRSVHGEGFAATVTFRLSA